MTTRTLRIADGPNLHQIERNLMAPRLDLAYLDPVQFEFCVGGHKQVMLTVHARLVLTGMKRLDDGLFAFEAWAMVKKDFNPLGTPPFQITSYSVKDRRGFVKISDALYESLNRLEFA